MGDLVYDKARDRSWIKVGITGLTADPKNLDISEIVISCGEGSPVRARRV